MTMKKLLIVSLLSCTLGWVQAQTVQWTFKVLEFSTEKSHPAFSAQQIIGKPNVYPASGEHKNAWQPNDKSGLKEEFIKVGFLSPLKAKQILIAETFHPGFISAVFVYDAQGTPYEVAQLKPEPANVTSRIVHVRVDESDLPIFAVKVVFKPSPGIPFGIDAIGITESEQEVQIKLNESDLLKANMVLNKLDKTVNSIYPEFGPLLSPDGKILYFSRRYDPKNMGGREDVEDIWYSELDTTTHHWKEAQNMGIPLNNKEPNFINSISPDGNTVLLGNSYYKDGTMDDGVSVSHRTSTGWTFPERLDIEDDRNDNDKANFFLSSSQRVLLMSVERKGDTKGDRDLYVSFPKNDSVWTIPMNLGSTINTSGTEAAPFLAADDRTLYFTSDGMGGYGGSDIYVTRRQDDSWRKWSEPENLGPVINTPYDESYFSLSASGDKVYFTSSAGPGQANTDMYTLSLPEVVKPHPVVFIKGRVLDSKTNQPLPAVNIYFENLDSGTVEGIAQSHPNSAEYAIVLPKGSHYGYLAVKEGYMSVSANLNVENLDKYTEIKQDLYLTPIEAGQRIVLHNLFFDFDKYELKKESYPELNRLSKLLKENKKIKVEISGFSDSQGSEAYNDVLSKHRAEAVGHYLLKKSAIDSHRLSIKSYGEHKPLADNATAEGRHVNRRVEFKILEK
jgi:outer membrane protein OmpA-like peptidoglycan-associated protein